MPFRALLNKETFWAEELTKEEKGKDFRCPLCNGEFLIVIPKKDIIKHFRHKTGKEHWEPETKEHLTMKNMIHSIGIINKWKTELEKPLQNKYIADIFIEKDGVQIAVECQCSNVTEDDLVKKDNFYLENNIYPLWIFGGSFYKHTKKRFDWIRDNKYFYNEYQIQKIKKIERMFLKSGFSLYYFGDGSFFRGSFKFRENAKTLGWYDLQKTSFNHLIDDFLFIHFKEDKS